MEFCHFDALMNKENWCVFLKKNCLIFRSCNIFFSWTLDIFRRLRHFCWKLVKSSIKSKRQRSYGKAIATIRINCMVKRLNVRINLRLTTHWTTGAPSSCELMHLLSNQTRPRLIICKVWCERIRSLRISTNFYWFRSVLAKSTIFHPTFP